MIFRICLPSPPSAPSDQLGHSSNGAQLQQSIAVHPSNTFLEHLPRDQQPQCCGAHSKPDRSWLTKNVHAGLGNNECLSRRTIVSRSSLIASFLAISHLVLASYAVTIFTSSQLHPLAPSPGLNVATSSLQMNATISCPPVPSCVQTRSSQP